MEDKKGCCHALEKKVFSVFILYFLSLLKRIRERKRWMVMTVGVGDGRKWRSEGVMWWGCSRKGMEEEEGKG